MSEPVKVDQGRVDHLAKGILKSLIRRYGNPQLRFTTAMLEEEIDACLAENLGPGTKADVVGKRVMRALERGQ